MKLIYFYNVVFVGSGKYDRTWRRPSAFFTIGEGSGEEGDSDNQYNEFDSDEDLDGPKNRLSYRRRSSVPFVYSSNSSLGKFKRVKVGASFCIRFGNECEADMKTLQFAYFLIVMFCATATANSNRC
jgi:hypothetical protein